MGQLQWLGLRSCRFHVGAGAFGAWLCLWEITRVFGKNNLVPTVTASFDVLEAGDMVEGCSIWVSVRLGAVRTVGCFLICRLLLRRLRFLLPCLRVRSCEEFLWLAAFLRSVAATSVQRSSLGVVSFV